ncbi:MAG: aerobic-type carbon monoxide dehydrogenase, middle subunit CoxM/CutM-like protein [Ramlibacter sp.]|jgi:carbon-monoxide dehydrogenase medium subunit|nr:aerobic-type carbon monoxide dehydrogenase, middle subunit CoxM/CutM-like protein [Ramlibacter sp.]
MKFPQFSYTKPASLSQALQILADGGDDVVPIAGGQSLLAGLSMRIAYPRMLVDLAGLPDLKGIRHDPRTNMVVIGAMTRHVEVANSPVIREHLPLLTDAMKLVAHVAVRNRGTLGGSLAYADPAAEMPACAVALDATLTIAGATGTRIVRARDFFTGLLETDLRAGELILDVRYPVPGSGHLHAILEFSRRAGDFAQAGVVVAAKVQRATLSDPCFVYFGCVDRARVAAKVGQLLAGRPFPLSAPAGLDEAVAAEIQPSDSPGSRADTKAEWARVLTRRVMKTLSEKAVP